MQKKRQLVVKKILMTV